MIYAKRYHWATANPYETTALLDAFVAKPEFLTRPYTPDEIRAIGAHLLSDPGHFIWTTYDEHRLTGVVILTRIIVGVDALLHFFFIDESLKSKRKLLGNLLTHCFTDLGFHRLSMEVPEGVRLERFARKVLSFRLEGEIRDRNPELPKCLDNKWVARQGSRREQSYFDGSAWKDIVLLRLLASEWVREEEGNQCLSQVSPQPPPRLSDPPLAESSAVEAPVTPSLSSPRTSRDSVARTSDSSSTS
jgi:RimJ/RimL family protein N-acetyltransferase